MKTLLVTALLAVSFLATACSSDNSSNLVTNALGTTPQGGSCTSSSQCESPLQCGFAIYSDAGACPSTGICTSFGGSSVLTACSCASPSVAISVTQNAVYASQPINPTATCSGAVSGEGGAPTTTGGTDASAGGATTGG
jgi:hypothetical protein